MSPRFQTLIDQASRLSRPDRLQAATQAIQRALQSANLPMPGGLAAGSATRPFFDAPMTPATSTATRGADDARFVSATHRAAGLQRDYKLFSPSTQPEGRRPLVVMLHGCKQNPDDFAAGTALNAAAEAEGFYVLYPGQSDQANPQRCWNWFKHNHQARGRGEPALIADMARNAAGRLPIDPDRIYIAGLSAGGAMAVVCADAYPDVFAAVGVHSGLPTGVAADLPSALAAMRSGPAVRPIATPASGMPTIVFHGDADGVVHPANGDAIFERSVGSAATVQTERVNKGGRSCTRRFVLGAEGQLLAEQWRIHGASHAWSGGSASGSYTDGRGPSASAEMMRFFAGHRRARLT
ncbi:MAG TPA: PHB depolymerase family esterase [Rubrivivax sp.]|nr:PHB depolymerase family esterase [Rubrivivax sp.]